VRLERERTAQVQDDELSDLSLHVLKALRTQERLTIAQLASITHANRNTLKVKLRELVSAGRVRQHGKARATWYSL
jgi:DNA-binding IclR family transcriptional regulator